MKAASSLNDGVTHSTVNFCTQRSAEVMVAVNSDPVSVYCHHLRNVACLLALSCTKVPLR